jgi:hypothetical protein
MSDEPQQRRVLRPVELSPEEAALAYDAVRAVNVPGARVEHAASLFAKVEAAMLPLPAEGRSAPPDATRRRRR